ncbi:3-deoxy-D-manno-octulosonic acid transferase [bacterium]|nr:3-deoxy-D-manno-octulosonic acid transferase [bacterium]
MTLLYRLGIFLYDFIIWMIAPYHAKAELLYRGRKDSGERIKQLDILDDKPIWIHCASLGEFEQGRPVIEGIKKKNPEQCVVLTFYSPSGYEIRKNYELADYIFYLPSDRASSVRAFIEKVNPSVAIFVKYEFWYNYLNQLKKKNIDTYIISAIFRKNQVFFKWYGGWYRKLLGCFNWLFVQDEKSGALLQGIGVENFSVDGDTRFDRVAEIAVNSPEFDVLKDFSEGAQVIVGGSTWPDDEKLLVKYLKENSQVKLLLAPHEIHEEHLVNIEEIFSAIGTQRYTQVANGHKLKSRVLIVNTMGMLSSMYRYGDIAHIGGGFGKGIHNTLEAATFGLPVLFGPNHLKFKEALDLIEHKAAFPVESFNDFKKYADDLLFSDKNLANASDNARSYVQKMCGATDEIIKRIL